jgi:hypothetical protein
LKCHYCGDTIPEYLQYHSRKYHPQCAKEKNKEKRNESKRTVVIPEMEWLMLERIALALNQLRPQSRVTPKDVILGLVTQEYRRRLKK